TIHHPAKPKAMLESDDGESLDASIRKPPLQNERPTSMVVEKVHNVIPTQCPFIS
ncbi:hypothetical protein FRX31_024906, partial [Thalictrum thalictroides]